MPPSPLACELRQHGVFSAVKEVHDEKVVLYCGKRDIDLHHAIGHARDVERMPLWL